MNRQNKQKITTKISLLLITRNEEENLKKSYDWLDRCPMINEVIVVDDNSNDETIKIVKLWKNKHRKVTILNRGLNEGFSAKRNYGLQHCSNDWILWLDADERPGDSLIQFLGNIDTYKYVAFSFSREDFFINRILKHGENANLKFIRLFNKNHGQFIGRVHEVWKTDGPVSDSCLTIKHYPHRSIRSLMEKINFYTDIRARELFDNQVRTNVFQIIFYPIGKFFQNYVFRLGFLDSTAGIVMALAMSFHSFLVRAKLWHLYHQ